MTRQAAKSVHGKRLNEVLADGEWHDIEDVIREVAKSVPPGVATRTAERHRKAKVIDGSRPNNGYKGNPVLVGARRVARELIWSRKHRGTVEVKDGKVRLRPAEEVPS